MQNVVQTDAATFILYETNFPFVLLLFIEYSASEAVKIKKNIILKYVRHGYEAEVKSVVLES